MEIAWITILQQLFEVVIIPLIGVLATILIKYLNTKSQEINAKVDNELASKYINMLDDTITSCVLATTQTYVDSLKKEGQFDKEAQKTAFKMTYDSVLNILTEESKEYLTEIYGDLSSYLTSKIESEVQKHKS